MAKDAGKKSFLDFFKVKNIDDDEEIWLGRAPFEGNQKHLSASQLHVPLPNTKQLHSRHRLHIGVQQAVHPVANWLISRTPRSLTAEAQISATVVKYL